MLLTCDSNVRLEALSDLIVDSTGIFQYIEEFGALMVMVETPTGFEWKDVTECVRVGASNNGQIRSIK